MLVEASLWWSTQLKTSKFFWRHLQQPWPWCVLTQMLRTAGCSAFNQFRIGFKSGLGLGDTQALKRWKGIPDIFNNMLHFACDEVGAYGILESH